MSSESKSLLSKIYHSVDNTLHNIVVCDDFSSDAKFLSCSRHELIDRPCKKDNLSNLGIYMTFGLFCFFLLYCFFQFEYPAFVKAFPWLWCTFSHLKHSSENRRHGRQNRQSLLSEYESHLHLV